MSGFFKTFFADIDECSEGLSDCHQFATCTNTIGSFDCKCMSGFEGDGRICIGILLLWNLHTNKEGSLQNVIIILLDSDECTTAGDNCVPNSDCINVGGSFQCVCRSGFQKDGIFCRGAVSSTTYFVKN